MSRSKNSRKGSKYVPGCSGCAACDRNWVERRAPPEYLSDEEFQRVVAEVIEDHALELALLQEWGD